jgi:hypothetical protein
MARFTFGQEREAGHSVCCSNMLAPYTSRQRLRLGHWWGILSISSFLSMPIEDTSPIERSKRTVSNSRRNYTPCVGINGQGIVGSFKINNGKMRSKSKPCFPSKMLRVRVSSPASFSSTLLCRKTPSFSYHIHLIASLDSSLICPVY